ncbi:hypothetical protein NEOLEDRAFT_1178937 [Neolentinus lepideus HHB14362 ss-1]|uniref:Uncharacterized protein n=1 Tax=Neolentinus lepideus HHB14362 ss-1 TaxID=1314782 RepID=A0A165S9U0_9AGAM|nr:hypothetical protein NEOLEDRAFT_1178937 [Neolentinus lepideus HHB14362 ss-1]
MSRTLKHLSNYAATKTELEIYAREELRCRSSPGRIVALVQSSPPSPNPLISWQPEHRTREVAWLPSCDRELHRVSDVCAGTGRPSPSTGDGLLEKCPLFERLRISANEHQRVRKQARSAYADGRALCHCFFLTVACPALEMLRLFQVPADCITRPQVVAFLFAECLHVGGSAWDGLGIYSRAGRGERRDSALSTTRLAD